MSMYEYDAEMMTAGPPQPAITTMLDARDIATLSGLMRELRDLTQSRRTFTATSDFLRRLGAESESPRLVREDALDS